MPKRIAFCADGTWNHPHDSSGVTPADTNVYKLHKALAITHDQIPLYDDGVGADGSFIERFLGGAFGEGLFKKIRDGYAAIAHLYESGDEIYIFGFSRGAYTARSLAGMIAACGLPTANFTTDLVKTAFQAYRDKSRRPELLATLAANKLEKANIVMVGVWDTVGALGIPGAVFQVDDLRYGFLDTSLNAAIRNAYHALSIDERRREFPPTLWTSAPASGQTIEQVWFAGVHSDVGGGYGETGLSDITLSWMLRKAQSPGLVIADDAAAKYLSIEAKHALDALHESWNVFWGFPQRRSIAPGSAIASSVHMRLSEDHTYAPKNLPANLNGYTLAEVLEIVAENVAAKASAGSAGGA